MPQTRGFPACNSPILRVTSDVIAAPCDAEHKTGFHRNKHQLTVGSSDSGYTVPVCNIAHTLSGTQAVLTGAAC